MEGCRRLWKVLGEICRGINDIMMQYSCNNLLSVDHLTQRLLTAIDVSFTSFAFDSNESNLLLRLTVCMANVILNAFDTS